MRNLLAGVCLVGACAHPGPVGPYLGQTPVDVAEPFAPHLIPEGLYTRDVTMTPDGGELYFTVTNAAFTVSTIMVTRRVGDAWTAPEVAPHMEDPAHKNLEPALSPDGERMFFVSNRPAGAGKEDIWVMDRAGDGWGEPRSLGAPINTEGAEFFPSVTRDGTLYFTRTDAESKQEVIVRARPAPDGFNEPELLPDQVNAGRARFNAFVDPDERYLIVPIVGLEDSLGSTDYYVVRRNADDTWAAPVNLGPGVNTESGREYSAYVSPNSEQLFFMATRPPPPDRFPKRWTRASLFEILGGAGSGNATIYWVRTSAVDALREVHEQ